MLLGQTTPYILDIKSFLHGQGYVSSTTIKTSTFSLRHELQTIIHTLPYCKRTLDCSFSSEVSLVAWNRGSHIKDNDTIYLIAVSWFCFSVLRVGLTCSCRQSRRKICLLQACVLHLCFRNAYNDWDPCCKSQYLVLTPLSEHPTLHQFYDWPPSHVALMTRQIQQTLHARC